MNVDRNNPNRNLAMQLYSDEELISYLQEFYYMEGRVPTQRDLTINNFKNYPNYGSYFLRFGSFREALIVSDLYDFVEHKHLYEKVEYTRELIIEIFDKFIKENNRFPNMIDLKKTKISKLPCTTMILKHFESIHELRELFGYSKEKLKELENKEALDSLYKHYLEEGFITSRTIDKCKYTKCTTYYINNFGSLINAYNMSGVPYPFKQATEKNNQKK